MRGNNALGSTHFLIHSENAEPKGFLYEEYLIMKTAILGKGTF